MNGHKSILLKGNRLERKVKRAAPGEVEIEMGRRVPHRRPRILQFEIAKSHPTDVKILYKATDVSYP